MSPFQERVEQVSNFTEMLGRLAVCLSFVLYLWSFCHWTFAACYLLIAFFKTCAKNIFAKANVSFLPVLFGSTYFDTSLHTPLIVP